MKKYLLPLGDVIALIVFATIGRSSHGEASGFSALVETLTTAAPFVLGWLLVAPWLGVYRPSAWASPRSAVWTVLKASVPAFVLAVLLRAALRGEFSPIAFYPVTFVISLAFLLAWRLLHWAWTTRIIRQPN